MLGALAAGCIAAFGSCNPSTSPRVATARNGSSTGSVRSNITRADYAGSAACQNCHAEIYKAWSSSPMHQMTRNPEQAKLHAAFDGREFRFKTDVLRLERHGDARFVRLSSPTNGKHLYRVTRVIGGRYREDFAGVEVPWDATQPEALTVSTRRELVLPVTHVFSPPSFRLKGYSVMVKERPGLKAGGVWNQTCIFCHNTVPQLSTLLGELLGSQAPVYQGEVVDRILPPDRQSQLHISDADLLNHALKSELVFLGEPARHTAETAADNKALLLHTLKTTRERFTAEHFVELGIGCEACHGGSREHVENPQIHPSFALKSEFLTVSDSAWARSHTPNPAGALNRACARCHQVLFSRYPHTWEGSGRNPPEQAGGSHISSGEARDFLLGGCSGQLACSSCHDPHAEDRRETLAALATPAGNRVCVRCHAQYASETALSAHSHHPVKSAGAACVNCHMPQKNLALNYALTRYHRIGSPTDRRKVEGDRPIECALCHTEQSTEQLVSWLEQFWHKTYDRAQLRQLYGDLAEPPLDVSVVRGKAHEQATAIAILGKYRRTRAVPNILLELTNSYPLVRYFAREALTQITGEPCTVNLDQELAGIQTEANLWFERYRASQAASNSAAPARVSGAP